VRPFGIDFVTEGWVLLYIWICISLALACFAGWLINHLRADDLIRDIQRHRNTMRALRPGRGR
jgi:hypothetical protein